MAEDAGALLVRSGLIAEEQLLIARQAQAGRGGTIGEHLVLAGFIEDQTLADFYRTRLMVPQVSLRQLARIPKHLIGKIPADMASEFRCIPVSLDKEGNLTVAMADPSATHSVDEIGFFTDLYVVRAVASQSQIAWCLAHYYGTLTPLGQKLMRNPEGALLPGPMPPPAALQDDDDDDPAFVDTPAQASPGGQRRRNPSITDQVLAARHPVLPPLSGRADGADADAPGSRLPLRAPRSEDRDAQAAVSGPVPVVIEPDPPPSRPPPPRPTSRNQRVISFLQEDTAPTGPMRVIKRPATNPPELIPRAGEFDVPTGPIPIADEHLPAVMVSLRSQGLRIDRPDHQPLPLPEPDAPEPEDAPEAEPGHAPEAETLSAVEPGHAPEAELAHAAEPEPVHAAEPEPDTVSAAEPDTVSAAEPDIVSAAAPAHGLESEPPVPDAASAADSGPADERTAEKDSEEKPNRMPDTSVVLLDRPKGKAYGTHQHRRRRHSTTKLGMGFDELDQAKSGPHGVASGVPSPADSSQGDRTVPNVVAPDYEQDSAEKTDRTSAPASIMEQTVLQGDADSQATVVATPEQPTTQMRAPQPYPDDWPILDPADSIHKAAEAAARAHAHREESQRHRRNAGPDTRPDGEGDAEQAVPMFIEDDDFREETPTDEQARAEILSTVSGYDGDEWGPPGTTIPPQYRGARAPKPETSTSIPLATDSLYDDEPGSLDSAAVVQPMDTADTTVTRTVPRSMSDDEPPVRRERSGPVQAPLSLYETEHVTPEVLREFEASQDALAEVLRQLQLADTRDAVIDILTEHLSTSHERVAFFAVKSGQLLPWATRNPADSDSADQASLNLDRPSTFQDIVGTRLPFRGPVGDQASRDFIVRTFGSAPDHMLGLPVSVRERVVGVLYGDTSTRRVFVQNLGVLARAAGGALERILKNQKSH